MTEQNLPALHPQWVEATKNMLKKSRPGVLSPDLTESRKQFFEMFDALAKLREPHAGAENVVSEDVLVDQHVRVRVYIPPTRDIRQQKPPLGLYIHSGGWFTGSIDAEDFLCRIIALESQMILFSPEYRLAPENPFPEGLKDCLAVYEYMHNQGAYYGGDPSKKFIMGGSAGGNLTACVGLNYASNANLRPTGMIVACMTSCDPRALPSEYKKRHLPNNYMDTPMINSKSMQTARDWLNALKPDDPLYSPLLHPDINLLPPIYITAMTNDPTYQETIFFYEECRKQGVMADLVEWSGLPHYFWIVPGMQKSTEFLTVWNKKLQEMIKVSID